MVTAGLIRHNVQICTDYLQVRRSKSSATLLVLRPPGRPPPSRYRRAGFLPRWNKLRNIKGRVPKWDDRSKQRRGAPIISEPFRESIVNLKCFLIVSHGRPGIWPAERRRENWTRRRKLLAPCSSSKADGVAPNGGRIIDVSRSSLVADTSNSAVAVSTAVASSAGGVSVGQHFAVFAPHASVRGPRNERPRNPKRLILRASRMRRP
jgi:hypothetical protein